MTRPFDGPWRWPNFTRAELACRHCGKLVVDPDFLDRLQKVRDWMGRPLVVSSGYRCPAYNNEVSKTGFDGPHTTGQAADILIYGPDALRLIVAACDFGMTGVGIAQRGPPVSRFIHLDDLLAGPGQPRPWPWSY